MKIHALILTALCLSAMGCGDQSQSPAPAPVSETAAQPAPPATEAAAATPPPSAIDENGPVDLGMNVDMPSGFETAGIETGECMAPVDYFNEKPVVPGPYAVGSDVTVTGWNITSSKDNPVPAAIFGVFKPYDKSMKGVLLSGERTERADVAGENKQFTMAGFRLAGKFPSTAGKYRFYVLTGTKDRLTECDSKIVVQIQ
jgi:hypothetical protein